MTVKTALPYDDTNVDNLEDLMLRLPNNTWRYMFYSKDQKKNLPDKFRHLQDMACPNVHKAMHNVLKTVCSTYGLKVVSFQRTDQGNLAVLVEGKGIRENDAIATDALQRIVNKEANGELDYATSQ